MSLDIQVDQLSGSALVRDYYGRDDRLAPFFNGSPWDPDAYRRKADEVDRRLTGPARREIMEAIRPTSPKARDTLERVAEGEGLLVTTGQQPGFLGGPLFTVHKILSAVQLARRLEQVLDRPVAPLFWIASDDHDWDEVNHVELLDRDNTVQRITVPSPPDAPPRSMAHRVLGTGIEDALDDVAQHLPDTEFAGEYIERIRATYRPDRTVAEAFGDLIAGLFERFDLLLVDSAHPVVKRRAADAIMQELSHTSEHAERVAEHTGRLTEAGYHAQVPVIPDAANVFYEDDRGRERLMRTASGWRLRRTGRTLTDEEVRSRLRSEPERFSPNVLLRPVTESAIFPTVAYVAGPGELSYYAQIGCLYRAHGIDMPVIFPRHSVSLVESKVRKVLDKFDLDIDELRVPVHEVAARVLKEELPDEVRDALSGLRRAVNEGAERLADAATGIDKTLKGPVLGVRNGTQVELGKLEKKIVQHMKDRNDVGVRQIRKARANLYPDGRPQERALNVHQYLVRYGPALLDRLEESLRVEIDAAAPAWAGVRCG